MPEPSRCRWTGLAQVTLAVADVDAAAGPVARLLGRRPSWRGEDRRDGTENALFRLANTVLELRAPAGPGPVAAELRARLDTAGEGLAGLALATGDADACAAALRAAGLEAGEPEARVGRDLQSGAFRRWRQVALPRARTRGVPLAVVEPAPPPEVLPEAPALFGEAGAVAGVDHVVVRTADPDGARRFYGDRLGLRLALDREFPDWGVRLLFFRVGGVTLEVAATRPGAEGAEGEAAAGGDRLWGVSYRVPDADAARERLQELGLDVSPVRPGRKPGTRVLTVRNAPCGVPTLLLEPRAAAGA